MDLENVLQSVPLKKRFCKDMCLPLTIFDEPYFTQRLKILDPIHHCLEQFRSFCADLDGFVNAEDYFKYYVEIKEDAIEDIQSNNAFVEFSNKQFPHIDSYQKQNLYTESNIGKTFISIDLRKANFTVLRMYDRHIFNYKDSWEKFMAGYTVMEHIRKSKYIRNVILGACNPGKQIQAERWYVSILAAGLQEAFPDVKIYSVNVDEIIIEYESGKGYAYGSILDYVNHSFLGGNVKVELFDLNKLNGIDGYFKRIYSIDESSVARIDIKGVHGELYHQVVKYLLKQPIEEDDLVFYHDGRLARFMEPIADPWANKL